MKAIVSPLPAAWIKAQNGTFGFHAVIDPRRLYRPRFSFNGKIPRTGSKVRADSTLIKL